MPLIQSLPGCPLDIIGDVHGQFEALQNLLHYLGYSPAGKHPQGRKLVFVGDLIDRGPDSPAVADWAKQAVNAGNAFMVLGNHEINLLAHEPKDGSGWFFDCRAGKDSHNYAPWQRQPENGKKALVQFFAEQPLVLQRPDLRIVHAAWLPESIAKLQNNATPLIQLIQEWDDELHCCIKHAPWYDDYLAEQHHHAHILENPAQHPPMLRATAAHDIYRSSRHPIRALTCGIEKIAREPFFAGGRWRFSIRNPWWDDYQDRCNRALLAALARPQPRPPAPPRHVQRARQRLARRAQKRILRGFFRGRTLARPQKRHHPHSIALPPRRPALSRKNLDV